MSLTETKQLLRASRIVPNKLLGQNFIVEPAIFPKLAEYADIGKDDVVLDVGAGFGFLTKFLASKCKIVVAIEKDHRVAAVLRERVKDCLNVNVVESDVLKATLPPFDKVVAIPPYYLSSSLIMWFLERKTERAVFVFQKEFAERLVASVGSEGYSWLTVLARHKAQAELFDSVPRSMFYPQPEIDSVIVCLIRRKKPAFEVKDEDFFNHVVRWLFTQRNKKIWKALVPFLKKRITISKEEAEKIASEAPFRDKRARQLSPEEFGELANALS